MVIVVDYGDDVQHYAADLRDPSRSPVRRPAPAVRRLDHLIGHGSYPRTVAHPTQPSRFGSDRLLCTACHHTVSLLPTFCLPWRHYATATIQTVLTLRIEAHASWRRIGQRFLPADLPTRTTCREWVGAFAHASTRYLPAVLQHLAQWASRSSAIEVTLADLGEQPDPPSQLVAAVPHLLVELREVGVMSPRGANAGWRHCGSGASGGSWDAWSDPQPFGTLRLRGVRLASLLAGGAAQRAQPAKLTRCDPLTRPCSPRRKNGAPKSPSSVTA